VSIFKNSFTDAVKLAIMIKTIAIMALINASASPICLFFSGFVSGTSFANLIKDK
jgi:hypothetical protein